VRQQHAIFILAAAMALAPTLPVSGHQEPQPDPAELIAVRLRPDTLALFINDVAGVRVRLVNGVVKGIASTRVFTVENERSARYPRRPSEVAVFVDAGSAVVREGAAVVVTGIARTLWGAEMNTDRPLPSLTESERNAVAKRPLVMASSVQTPDGVQLVRPSP
jgi:hypothetical protein